MCEDTPSYHGMRMLGVSNVYPSTTRPDFGTFAEVLFHAIEKNGVDVEVLAPFSKTRELVECFHRKFKSLPLRKSLLSCVHRPRYWSASTRFLPWKSLGTKLSNFTAKRAIENGFPWSANKIDFVHSYFFSTGRLCLDVCEQYKIPCFVELGESSFKGYENEITATGVAEQILRFTGVVAVSENTEDYIRSLCPGIGDRLIHLPNSVNTDIFKPHNRVEARKYLGLSDVGDLAIFCGHYIERKGPLRVNQALEILGNVSGLFVGRGSQIPLGKHVLHTGQVENNQIPLWLSAADVFVLPSLAEGMCVAIIEALACGLPVVVSDRSFNRSFLTENCAVFVDPTEPESIADGIKYILSDRDRYNYMSKSAFKLGESFSSDNRAKKLLSFVEKRLRINPN